jgi:hypothetical protein
VSWGLRVFGEKREGVGVFIGGLGLGEVLGFCEAGHASDGDKAFCARPGLAGQRKEKTIRTKRKEFWEKIK